MPQIVALDIETTGFDPNNDKIIEIGAIRFNHNRIEKEWSSLINPGCTIPLPITQLTGITNQMVKNAPIINDVIDSFNDFVGDYPVLGHNIKFDLSFLKKINPFKYNDIIDTYELASVLMPSTTSYNLGALAKELGVILVGNMHRALFDAKLTHAVYTKLYEKSQQLPPELLTLFIKFGNQFDWGANYVFAEIHKTLKQGRAFNFTSSLNQFVKIDKNLISHSNPLIPNETLQSIDPDEVAEILENTGAFSKYFEKYERRSQQIEMLRSITSALSNSQHLMVEAGTGIGKSFAYLIPATIWATKNNTRVVISTNTINLQDQLINKDIPDLKNALGINFNVSVLKGKSNYLCPSRIENLIKIGPKSSEEMRILAKILVWLNIGGKGDRSEINLNGPIENEIWINLSARSETCKHETCLQKFGGACPFFQARQASQESHLVIVNHALLLADFVTGNRIIPDYSYLIVDEAHHLESSTTNSLSYEITQREITMILRELGGISSGVLGYFLSHCKNLLKPPNATKVKDIIQTCSDLSFQLEKYNTQFFGLLHHFLEDQRDGKPLGFYSQRERITHATRTIPIWDNIENEWSNFYDVMSSLLNQIDGIIKSIADLEGISHDVLEETIGNLGSIYQRLEEVVINTNGLIAKPQNDIIYWIDLDPNRKILSLHAAPLNIGPLMQKYLWHEKESVILTSATLTTNGEFDYIRNRLFAEDADDLILGSPFDFENSALLFIPNDIPDPSDTLNYIRSVANVIISVGIATQGRLMALFTSYTQLKQISKMISEPLQKHNIEVLEQGGGASSNTLLENFRNSDSTVLLGTRSFWEGVDIPGEALSALVIAKLPFDVPNDPIIAARSETFDDPFGEYQIPEAILRFRQGFGRLIRTETDKGIVILLDKRVITKRYGRYFIDSLPDCTVKIGTLLDAPKIAVKWLNIV